MKYNYQPKTREELKELIAKLIEERGDNADLNDIDTSLITDMSFLFFGSRFHGDLSKWDVGNVKDMSYMFAFSHFSGDLSEWKVDSRKIKSLSHMFINSPFNDTTKHWRINPSKTCITKMFGTDSYYVLLSSTMESCFNNDIDLELSEIINMSNCPSPSRIYQAWDNEEDQLNIIGIWCGAIIIGIAILAFIFR